MNYTQLPLMGDVSFRIDYSRLADFIRCPLRYKYQYIDQLNERIPRFYYKLGNALHISIRKFFDQKDPSKRVVQTILDSVKAQWNSDWFISRNEEIEWLKKVDVIGERFIRNYDPSIQVIAIEESFSAPMGELLLTGKIDRIDQLSDGTYQIIDYKLGHEQAEIDFEELSYSLQPAFYYYGATNALKIKPANFIYYLFLTGERFVIRYTKEEIAAGLEKIQVIADSARFSSEYPPRRNPYCQDCTYICPLFPNRH
jgi:RecB family exonuclease